MSYILHPSPSLKKSGQELKQSGFLIARADTEAMGWGWGAAYWLVPQELLTLLSHTT